MGEETLNKGKIYIKYPDDNEWHELAEVIEAEVKRAECEEAMLGLSDAFASVGEASFEASCALDSFITQLTYYNSFLEELSKYAPNKRVRHFLSHGKRRTRAKAYGRCFKEMIKSSEKSLEWRCSNEM